MAVISAEALQQRAARKLEDFPVAIAPGVEFLVRRPDLRKMIYEGVLPTPLTASINTLISTWMGQDLKKIAEDAQKADGANALACLNRLAVIVAVSPQIVLTEEEVVPGVSVWVDTLEVDEREQLVLGAMTRDMKTEAEAATEREAAERFPEDGHGEGAAPDVQDVRATPEPSPEDSGS